MKIIVCQRGIFHYTDLRAIVVESPMNHPLQGQEDQIQKMDFVQT